MFRVVAETHISRPFSVPEKNSFNGKLYVKLKFAGIFGQGEAENPHRDGARKGPFVHVRVRVRLGVQRQEHPAAAHGEEAQPLCQEDEDAAVPELTAPSLDDSLLSPPTLHTSNL